MDGLPRASAARPHAQCEKRGGHRVVAYFMVPRIWSTGMGSGVLIVARETHIGYAGYMADDSDPMLPYLHQVRLIDRQHRRLFDLITNLASGKIDTPSAIDDLDAYVDRHFRVEEEIMETLEYPDRAGHVREHDQFRSKVAHLRGGESGSFAISDSVVRYLRVWLQSHIGGTDRGLCDFIKKEGL